MIVIGVTGGMASGKSTVARMFAGRGIRHVDADALVHWLMRHDRKTIAAIAKAFSEIVTPAEAGVCASNLHGSRDKPGMTATIDRAVLADIISKDPSKIKTLEQILHPRVRDMEVQAIHQARRQHARAIILDIPLLFETDAHELCDITIAVRAPPTHRRRRAFRRLGMTEEKWQKLLARQLPDHARIRQADLVIETGIGKAATRRTVKRWMVQWGLA